MADLTSKHINPGPRQLYGPVAGPGSDPGSGGSSHVGCQEDGHWTGLGLGISYCRHNIATFITDT